MNRRRFLARAATGSAVVLAGCQSDRSTNADGTPTSSSTDPPPGTTATDEPPGTATGTRTPKGASLELVEPDVAQGEEVGPVVEAIEPGQLLSFPPGRFRWGTTAHVTVDEWGIRAHDDTIFEVPAGLGAGDNDRLLSTHLARGTADEFFLENLTFDSPGRAAPGMILAARNRAAVDGLHYRMNGPLSDQMHENGMKTYVENPSGELRITDFRQFNNGDIGGYASGESRVGVWVGAENQGTVHLRNPVLQGFPNNACYVSRQPGTVIVEGGLLMNNNVSAVRVGGGVEVVDTTILVDVDRYRTGPGRIDAAAHNTRGVWGDSRQAGRPGGIVRECSFVVRSYQRSTGLATILDNPGFQLDGCQFRLDADITAVQADAGEIAVADGQFTGTATGATAGTGDITGTGADIAPNIEPGAVPVTGHDATFDWSLTHPETPGRSSRELLLPPALIEALGIQGD